jgi:hypothetical protein
MVTVWNILLEMFGQMPAWPHAASTKKEKNGRKLYRFLFAHYLGSDHVIHLANKMEACLASLTYNGKQCPYQATHHCQELDGAWL